MAYILFHIKTNMFLKHPNTWTPNLRKATKFQTEEKVNNYMTKNFPFVFKNIPVEDIEILNTDNITEDFESQHNTSTPPQPAIDRRNSGRRTGKSETVRRHHADRICSVHCSSEILRRSCS